jgi:hypothetical protein
MTLANTNLLLNENSLRLFPHFDALEGAENGIAAKKN